MGSTWSVIRGFNGSLRLWLLAWALASFAYFGLQAVLLNLYLLRLGFGPQFIGLLVGSGQVIWGLAALPAGALGRRVGLRTAQQAALVLLAVGFGAVLVVEALPRPLWEVWLFGWWAIGWIGAALLTVNLVPYLMAIADDLDQRNAVFPVQTAVSTLMTLVGSLIAGALPGLVVSWTGGSLGEPAPFRTALWPMPVLFVAAALVLGGAREARMADAARAGEPAAVPPFGLFLLIGAIALLQNAAEGPARAFFNVYLDRGLGVATDQIGLIIGLAQLLPVATALLAVRLLAHYGAALTLALASLGACLAYLPLAGVAAWVPAALGFMGVMMMAAIHVSARGVFSQEVVIPRWRTTTSAILTIGMALGWASTAAGGGFVIASFGFGALFAISAGLAAGAAALAWSAYRMRAGRAAVALTSMPSPSSR